MVVPRRATFIGLEKLMEVERREIRKKEIYGKGVKRIRLGDRLKRPDEEHTWKLKAEGLSSGLNGGS